MILAALGALPAAKAAVLAGLVALMVGGIATAIVGVKAYGAGREKERLVQVEIIAKMVERSRQAAYEQRAKIETLEESWRLARRGADNAQERERASTRRALAAVNADRSRMREQLDAVALGGLEAGGDTVGACRQRAGALGRVLGDALQASAECAAAAEDLAAGVRALRSAWPMNAVSAAASAPGS